MEKKATLCFATTPSRKRALDELMVAVAWAEKRGHDCLFSDDTAKALGMEERSLADATPDFVIALGGDGTILHAARTASEKGAPVLGVNFGRVGFLSEISPDAFDSALSRIEAGEYTLDRRMMLSCSVNDGVERDCLNEALLYKRSFSGIVDISMEIDSLFAGNVKCDGIIVSTSTGSTGYSISAGGPVIAPGLDVVIVTPICPHTLSARPIIASSDADMRFSMKSEGYVSLDGIYTSPIHTDDVINVRRSKRHVDFIRFEKGNLYSLIQNKLS